MPRHAHGATQARTRELTVEIRPGEGGDDATRFADELTDAICAHARRTGCSLTRSGTDRTITVHVTGPAGALDQLERFTGIHRIQRVPVNDTRRHTSTVTVAVLDGPLRPVGQVAVDRDDLDIFPFKGSGAGGQHRNRSFTCVRVLHRPTGTVAVGTRHRSQHQNLLDAIAQIEATLTARQERTRRAAVNDRRTAQLHTGVVKQFTWNTQRDEVIDHTSGNRWSMRKVLKGRIS